MPLPELLVRRYLDRRLVLFAGAGIAQAGGLPSWPGLLRGVLEYARADQPTEDARILLDKAESLCTTGDLILALSVAQQAMTSAAYGQAISQALDDAPHDIPPLAHRVAALAPTLRGVVTTNLDRFLERAFAGAWPVTTLPQLDHGQREHTILKLHGCRTDRNSWVLTRREYDALMHRRPELREHMRSLYRAETLLFVGYGLQDPDLDAMLTEMRAFAAGAPPHHYALMPRDQVDPSQRRHLLAEAGIHIVEYDSANNHRALLDLLDNLAASQTTSPAPPRPTPAKFAACLAPPSPPARVLLVAANPGDTIRLQLDEEAAAILESIHGACGPNILDLHTAWAVDFPRLLGAALRHRPHILHFSGHGSSGVIHVTTLGQNHHTPLHARDLADLIAELDGLRCVVLCACESSDAALAVLRHVPCVVAMQGLISDTGARVFSSTFYQALGHGRAIGPAFRLARTALAHASPDERELPRLHVADGVDEENLRVVDRPN